MSALSTRDFLRQQREQSIGRQLNNTNGDVDIVIASKQPVSTNLTISNSTTSNSTSVPMPSIQSTSNINNAMSNLSIGTPLRSNDSATTTSLSASISQTQSPTLATTAPSAFGLSSSPLISLTPTASKPAAFSARSLIGDAADASTPTSKLALFASDSNSPKSNFDANKRIAELETQLANEQRAAAQLRITLLAYENELQQLYEERTTSNAGNGSHSIADERSTTPSSSSASTTNNNNDRRDDKLIEEMSGNMRELFDQVASLSEANRQKTEENELLEKAFNQLKQRYDDLKSLAKTFKENEAKLIAALSEAKKEAATTQAKFTALRTQAQQKLTNASEQIDRLKSVSEREIAVLRARLLKYEANVMSLQEALRQKDVENRKISHICDDLINRLEHPGAVADVLRVTTDARRQLIATSPTAAASAAVAATPTQAQSPQTPSSS